MASQKEIASLVITLEGQIKQLKKDFGLATKELNTFQKQHKSVFKEIKQNWLLYTAAIAGATIALKRFVGPFASFRNRMLEVNTLVRLSNKELKQLEKTLLDMTRRVPQSATQLADALYDIVSAGVAVGESTDVLEKSAKAAVAGITTTQTAARTGLAVINAYGKEIGELDEVYDILFKTVEEGVLTFETIASSIGTVLPSARAAGVEFKDIAASLATLTKSGIDTARATTFMRSGLVALSAPTKEAKEQMDAMGITWEGWVPTLRKISSLGLDLKQMRKLIPDLRAGQAILSLAQNFETLEETLEEIDDSQGAMQNAFNIMEDAPINIIRQLGNAVDEFKVAISAAFAPEVTQLIKNLTKEIVTLAEEWAYLNTLRVTDTGVIQEGELELNQIRKTIIELRKRREQLELDKASLELIGDNTDEITAKIERYNKAIIKLTGDLSGLLPPLKQVKETADKIDDPSPTKTLGLDSAKIKIVTASLKIFEAQIQGAMQELDATYKDSQITISQYYTQRRSLAQATADVELNTLRDALSQTTDLNDQQKISAEIAARQIKLKNELNGLTRQEIEAERALGEAKKETGEIILDIENRILALDRTEQQNRIAELEQRLEDEKKTIIDSELDKADKIKAIERTTTLFKKEQAKIVADYEKQLSDQRLQEISNSLSELSNLFGQFYNQRINLVNILQQAIANAERNQDTAQAESLKSQLSAAKDSARRLFALQKAAALAQAIIQGNLAVTKAYADGGVGLAIIVAAAVGLKIGAIAAQALAGPGFAKGGEVHGKSGTDQINARLTDREFVQPVSAVDHYGTGVMEAIRTRSIPKALLAGYGGHSPLRSNFKFQQGGLATTVPGGAAGGNDLIINNIVDPQLFGQFLVSQPGQALVVNVISNNKFRIKRSLSG